METKNKTFQQLYTDAVNAPKPPKPPMPPTPREEFLQQMASLTNRSVHTIYAWGIGARQPDPLAARVIAQALGTTVETLFPTMKTK